MKELNEREQLRCKSLLAKDNDLQVGDKCPRDDCRGILEDDGITVFNPKADPIMAGFKALCCDRKKCDFQYVTKEGSKKLKEWQASKKEGSE